MHSVTCRFNEAEFSGQMTEIREWLDVRRCDRVEISYRGVADATVVIRLGFARSTDAYDFAQDFDGEIAVYA